jgi:hypothetical protein
MNKVIRSSIVVISAIVLLSIGWFANTANQNKQTSDAKSVANKFTTSILSNNNVSAYAITTKGFKSGVTQSQFDELFKDSASKTAKITNEAVGRTSKSIVVIYTITGLPKNSAGSTVGLMTVTLEKESGKWLVKSGILY